jgi:putative ABC transport system ATP-binding protein
MKILLDHIIPTPLKDRFSQNGSAIWNTSVQFTQGEYIKIKAPSGTGKTTLVHILYHIRHDYEGKIVLDDRPATAITGDALALLRQKQVSIIFQDLRLFQQLTARENIELKRVMQQPFYESSVIHEMAAELGIEKILDQEAGLCSYGEQQRIAIIRSLMQPFEWLIMDEPFSHLDIENTQKAAALIARECRKRDAGFIITDLDEDSHFTYSRQLHL